MNTLLLRLVGPMQSWGTQSRFAQRDAGREPSKSGVVGLLCAAIGRLREEPVDDLAALLMGVRVDREGSVAVEFQTAGALHRPGGRYGFPQAPGRVGNPIVSRRDYLADADFLVGLEGEDLALLHRLDVGLHRPHWPLCLGRKGYIPAAPVGLRDGGLRPGVGLEAALASEPPSLWSRPRAESGVRRRLILEDPRGAEVRLDQPVGVAFQARTFAPRNVTTDFLKPLALPAEPAAAIVQEG